MIQEIIKLGDKTAKDCMTPRVDTFAVPDDLPNDEAIALFQERRHRRVPVYADTLDQIVGIVDVKISSRSLGDLHRDVDCAFLCGGDDEGGGFPPPLSFPAAGSRDVVDEFDGTEGIITLDDIIEEIISDAAPLGDAELYIEPL